MFNSCEYTHAAAHWRALPFEEGTAYYYDWGAKVPFSLAGHGEGRCSAGIFDFIEMDLKNSHHVLREGHLYAAGGHKAERRSFGYAASR